MFQMIPIVIILAVIFAFIKLLQKKRKWNQMTNKEKVLFYEKQLEKYAENGVKSSENKYKCNDIRDHAEKKQQ